MCDCWAFLFNNPIDFMLFPGPWAPILAKDAGPGKEPQEPQVYELLACFKAAR